MAQVATVEFLKRNEEIGARGGCTPEEARAFCHRLAALHYENFPITLYLMRRDRRDALCAVYTFARLADDFADEPRYAGQRLEWLDEWERRLEAAAHGDAHHPVFVALAEAMQRFQIPAEWLRNLLGAFRRDATVNRYATFDDLLGYCRLSANPVGRIILKVFGYDDPELWQLSDNISTALQITNHLQDVSIDLDKDRIYLPQRDMAYFGVSEDLLFDRCPAPNFEDLMRLEAERAWDFFDRGRELVRRVGSDLGLWIRLVWLGGTCILGKIATYDYDVFNHRPTITTGDKMRILARAIARRSLPPRPQ